MYYDITGSDTDCYKLLEPLYYVVLTKEWWFSHVIALIITNSFNLLIVIDVSFVSIFLVTIILSLPLSSGLPTQMMSYVSNAAY